jgi:AbrB family looped-hinge helix DNA binding protein
MKGSIIKATTHGRITIPIAVRKKLGIKSGTRFNVFWDSKLYKIILTPLGKLCIASKYNK